MSEKDKNDELATVIKKLDTVISLLEDLFILEGVKMNVDKEKLRSMFGVRRDRVTRISKLVKEK